MFVTLMSIGMTMVIEGKTHKISKHIGWRPKESYMVKAAGSQDLKGWRDSIGDRVLALHSADPGFNSGPPIWSPGHLLK